MMSNKPIRLLLILCGLLWIHTGYSHACGGLFCQNVPVDQQAERIIFTMNSDDTITAYVQINYSGEAPDFSWVVPVPSIPTLDVTEIDVFNELDRLTQPIILFPQVPACADFPEDLQEPLSRQDDDYVDVLASGTAGPYAFDVIDSDEPDALIAWLRDNNYRITQEMGPLVDVYNEEGMLFLAMKLQPEIGIQAIRPIAMTYTSDLPMIPIRLTAVAAEPNMTILTWVFADEQAVPDNYAHITISNEDIRADLSNFAGHNYLQLLDTAIDEANGLAMITEYAQPTSELAQMQITDSLLQELVQDYDYLTRLLGRMSPEEMTLDPISSFDDNRLDVSNSRDLSQFDAETVWGCSDDVHESQMPLFPSVVAIGLVIGLSVLRSGKKIITTYPMNRRK